MQDIEIIKIIEKKLKKKIEIRIVQDVWDDFDIEILSSATDFSCVMSDNKIICLNLSNCKSNLVEISPEFRKFNRLNYLILSENSINDISFLSELRQLKYINIDNNYLNSNYVIIILLIFHH